MFYNVVFPSHQLIGSIMHITRLFSVKLIRIFEYKSVDRISHLWIPMLLLRTTKTTNSFQCHIRIRFQNNSAINVCKKINTQNPIIILYTYIRSITTAVFVYIIKSIIFYRLFNRVRPSATEILTISLYSAKWDNILNY